VDLPRLIKPFKHVQGPLIHEQVTQWYKGPLGQRVLASEKEILSQILPSMFGYHLMQLGVGQPEELTDCSPITHKVFVYEKDFGDKPASAVKSRPTQIAIETGSIDVALLHHTLDFETNPHKMLREVTRTIIPEGKLVIVGFNPWSLWGGVNLFKYKTTRVPWCANFISPVRLSDWLSLLDFEVEGCESTFFGPPAVNRWFNPYLEWLEIAGKRWWVQRGAVYTLVATKRMSTLTPIKRRRLVVKPTLLPVPRGASSSTSRNRP